MARKTSIELFQELVRELRGDRLKPVYYICSEESFFLDRVFEIISKRVPDDQKDFNFDVLSGRETNMDRVLSIARSFPMMADRRVLIIRDFLAISEGEAAGNPDELMPYLESPNPGTLLVLLDEKSPAGNTKLGKAIQKNGNVGYYKFDPVPDYRLPDWIAEWAGLTHHTKIDSAAAQILAQHVGNNLLQLTTEIEKLSNYETGDEAITVDAVRRLVGITRQFDVFELKDAILSGDSAKALFVAGQMLIHSGNATGEVMKTIGFLYGYYTNLWQICRGRERRLAPARIQELTGIRSNFYFNNLLKDARSFHTRDFALIFEALLDADKAVKGFGNLSPEDVLFLTINKLVGVL